MRSDGIRAINVELVVAFESAQIHFLNDVFVAVAASLLLKLPNVCMVGGTYSGGSVHLT